MPQTHTFNKMKTYLHNSIERVKYINQFKLPRMTGGIDSCVLAALTRELTNDIEYMTYTKTSKNIKNDLAKLIYTNDQKITEQMQQNLPWRHTIFNLDKFEPTGSSIKENERILYSNHSYKFENYYNNHR